MTNGTTPLLANPERLTDLRMAVIQLRHDLPSLPTNEYALVRLQPLRTVLAMAEVLIEEAMQA